MNFMCISYIILINFFYFQSYGMRKINTEMGHEFNIIENYLRKEPY